MSINVIMLSQAVAEQTVVTVAEVSAREPNWTLIAIIAGIIAILAIAFLIPSKPGAIEDLSKKDKLKALTDGDSSVKSLEDKSSSVDKDKLSLAEIRENKRAAVSEEASKEDLRELRKSRRAATQTQNAVHHREEAELAAKAEQVSLEESEVSEEAVEENLFADAHPSDSEDIFSSFFDNNNFEDDSVSSPSCDVIPTLGSALISLDAMRAAADASEDEGDLGLFNGMLANADSSAEKKTLS